MAHAVLFFIILFTPIGVIVWLSFKVDAQNEEKQRDKAKKRAYRAAQRELPDQYRFH